MIVENVKKVFTNDVRDIIIKKNYNPLKANKIEREGLCMKEKELNNNKNFIKLLTKICLDLKVKNYEEEIKKFIAK